MESLLDYSKNYILEQLDNYEGTTQYACELAMTLTECADADGTLVYCRNEAIDYLREWWYDCADYWDFENDNFGRNYHNPFDNPEAYMVCMVIAACETILSKCPVIDEHWNEQIELTEDVVNDIKEYVKEYNDNDLF